MEYVLDEYIIANILSFLDQKSLKKYDNAITSKKLRKLYLVALEKSSLKIRISSWTILRNIKKVSNICHYLYAKFYEYNVKKLIICGCRSKFRKDTFVLENDYISMLHIDIFSTVTLTSLRAKNLKTIFIVNLYDINKYVLKNLHYTCPQLKKITIIFPSEKLDKKIILINKNINIHVI